MMNPPQFAADQREACRLIAHIIIDATVPRRQSRHAVTCRLNDAKPHSVSLVAGVS